MDRKQASMFVIMNEIFYVLRILCVFYPKSSSGIITIYRKQFGIVIINR